MTWFSVAIISYILMAVVNLTDKFLIDNVVKSSKTYTFLVCFLSLVIFLAAPWFLEFPGWRNLLIAVFSGSLFMAATFFMYEALRRSAASQTIIIIGGLVPVFTALFSFAFLREAFSIYQIGGLVLLITGTFLIAFLPTVTSFWEKIWQTFHPNKYKRRSWRLAVLSAFFYATFFVATKEVYTQQPFVSGFMWLRLGAALAAALFLLDPKSRQEIIKQIFPQKKKKSKNNNFLFLANQSLGALSSVLQNYAIFLGPVAIITALQGVQYGVLIVLSFVLGLFIKQYKEKFVWRVFWQKLIALLLISGGLYLTAFQL
jgi:drug/metabolite transporter (DMT)-like permease